MRNRVIIINNGVEKNIASLQNMSDELVPPLYLRRDSSLVIQDEEPQPLNQAKITRKKAEILEYQEPEEKQECEEEKIPWLLEDSEQKAFVGKCTQIKLAEDHVTVYYAMVREKNEMRLYRIKKWYKFTPKIQYETLTLEEAEEKMQKKGKDASTSEPLIPDNEEYNREEELDYKEVFDDDDGETIVEKAETKKKKKLDSSGKSMRKLVKNYEKNKSESSNESSGEEKSSTEKESLGMQEITELDIKGYLYSGPLPVKTLIEKFKARLRTHPESKNTLHALIKRMCNIRTNPRTGEKLLFLKEIPPDQK